MSHLTLTSAAIDELRRSIIAEAADAHAQYPQYEGHWDGPEWRLAVFTGRVRTKGGIAFEKGDVTIARPPANRDEHDRHPVAYSRRNRIDTAVYPKDFYWVQVGDPQTTVTLRTYSITIPLTLEVIARDEQEARNLMRDHLEGFPPDWLHHRVHDPDVTIEVVEDVGQSINEGRYEDEED